MHETGQVKPADLTQRGPVRRVVVRKLGVFSIAKIFGLVYAGIGVLFGALISFLSIAGSVLGSLMQNDGSAIVGVLFGAGAIIFLPLFYGVLGFVITALGAAIYNLAASLAGGIEMEITEL